jgi:YD repeat-containing protein
VVLTHEYDAVGNRTDLTHGPDGVIVDGAWSYLHDGRGNLTRVTLPTSEHVELFYDPADRLERIVAANTAEMQVLYDALTGRPDSIAHTLGAATLAGFDYGFDTDGKILSIADAGGTREFTYDATLQLTGGGYAGAEFYSYDAEGNRETSHLSPSYTHDAANRLRSDEDTCSATTTTPTATLRPGGKRSDSTARTSAARRRPTSGTCSTASCASISPTALGPPTAMTHRAAASRRTSTAR